MVLIETLVDGIRPAVAEKNESEYRDNPFLGADPIKLG